MADDNPAPTSDTGPAGQVLKREAPRVTPDGNEQSVSSAEWMPRPPDHPEALPWPVPWREYPADHRARRKDCTPNAPFNENWARADFGDAFVDQLTIKQEKFRGDWWMLAMLIRCAESAEEFDPEARNPERLAYWNKNSIELRYSGVVIHLEHAEFRNAGLEHTFFFEARLEHADFSKAQLDPKQACSSRVFFRLEVCGTQARRSRSGRCQPCRDASLC